MLLKSKVYLVLIFGYVSNCQNYFFTANRNSEYRCVTNSSFALSWIGEDVNKALNQVSRFIPQKTGRNFDCKIGNDTRTFMYYLRNPWKLKRSHNELILDQRWEEMNVVLSDADTFTGEALHFKQILSNLENNFEVPFSIRTEKEAHIFLCDGSQPPTSNCYWFMLQAFDGRESAIRKCAKNFIPATNHYFAKKPCSTKLTKIQHPQFPSYLSNKFWTHFKIIKKANNLSLVKFEEANSKIILDLEDEGQIFNVTHLTVYSRHTSALWKFHSLDYIYTNEQSQEINIGSSIKPSEGLVCVTMFVSMCKSCKLKLSITSDDKVIEQKLFGPIEPIRWSQIRLIAENVTSDRCRLLVSTIGLGSDRFWAIDNVRQCEEKNEFRMITLDKKSSCQLLSGESNVILPHSKLETFENSCPEDTIGESCVPCHWIFDKCHQIKICSKNRCFCSAGFNNTECLYACNPGYYGHGCQKKCQNCAKICSSVNGTCSSCSANYSGPKCEFAPATIFTKAPIVVSVNDTKVKINVTNFEVLNDTKDDHPLSFSIEIKETDNNNKDWITVGQNFPFYRNQSFDIKFLKADTTYFVRTVVTTSKKKVYSDPRIPYATFTTKCQEISENNIKVISTNTSANVSLEQIKDPKICRINRYQVKIGNLSSITSSGDNFVFFDNLAPFTNYTIEIQRSSKKHVKMFQTLEGEPEKIQNLRIDHVSSSSCSLNWQKPSKFNGKFQFYTIEIKHQYYLACDFQPNNSLLWNVKRVQNNTAILNDLVPFSKYLLEIYAVNTRFSGQKVTLAVSTKPSDTIYQEEIPNIARIFAETHAADTILSQVECTQMRGPLIIKTTTTCLSIWCANSTSVHYSNQISRFTLRFLKPFTDYHLQLEFCRNFKNCSSKTIDAKFKTKPAAPGKVRNVSVISKNGTTIWIRWQSPDPPNGILKNYKLLMSYYNTFLRRRYEKLVFINGTNCKLWPSFLCATLHNLKSGTHYIINLSGRNEEPSNYGESVSIETITRIEPSEAPSDLDISWTYDNDLELEWKHPNRSNGQIEYFKIKILAPAHGISIEKKLLVTEDTYNSSYCYKVPMKNVLLPATAYDIKISAFNGLEGKELVKNDTSPPKAPSLVQEPLFSSSDSTIKVEIFLEHPQEIERSKYELFLKISEETVAKCDITNFEKFSVVIGNEQKLLVNNCDKDIKNPPLRSGTFYNITIRLKNSFRNKTNEKIYSFTYHTSGLSELHQYYLFGSLIFLLIMLIPILVFLFLKRKRLSEISETEFELQNQTPLVTFKKANNEKIEADNTIFSKPIQVSKFEIFIKESEQNREFERQHSMILKNPIRTIYETTAGSHYFDYIDLQFVNGFKLPKVYIASEVPQKVQAISDFWKTIWEENVKHVILDGDIKNQKTFQYWPENDSKMHCHDLTVELMLSKKFQTYEYKKFLLVHDDEIRHVEHFQNIYFGFNPEKFVPLFKRMLKLSPDSSSPMFVHSYSGLNRTGFILMCDMCLRMAEKENVIDVLRNFNRLSNCKVELVDDLEYYKLAHWVVSACLLPGNIENRSTNLYYNF